MKTLLLIEDDEINRQFLLEILQEDYVVLTAANGQQESGKPARFVAFAGFEGANLVHNPELTQSV